MKKRLSLRKNINKYDKFNYSFYEKVQKGFLKIARNNKNYIIIDSNKKNIKENSNIIIENIKKKISI
jgi:dTMP kinase